MVAVTFFSPLGPYTRAMPRALPWSYGGGSFLGTRYPCKPYILNPTTPQPGGREVAGAPMVAVTVQVCVSEVPCRGTSLIRNRIPLGPYSRAMPRALPWSYGGCCF